MSVLIECPKLEGRDGLYAVLMPERRYTALVEVDRWLENAMQADSAEEIITQMRGFMDEVQKDDPMDYCIEGYVFLTHELLNGGADHGGFVRRMMHEKRVRSWVMDDGFSDLLGPVVEKDLAERRGN